MRILVAGGTGTAGRVIARRASAAGHAVRVLSRSAEGSADNGVLEHVAGDLTTGAGLAGAMNGVDVVIDAGNRNSPFYRTAAGYFVEATQQLVAAERRAGVARHVVLSIAGIDHVDTPYYRAKLEQERVARRETARAGIGCTIARVSQFHDFATLVFRDFRLGPVVLVPPLHLQPVHLDDVSDHLLALADAPAGPTRDLIGPQPEELTDMVERYAATRPGRVRQIRLPLPAGYRRANEAGALKPAGALLGRKTFAEWLADDPA